MPRAMCSSALPSSRMARMVLHTLRRQKQPVQKRGIAAAFPGLFHIKAVLPDNLFRSAPNACGHQAQGQSLLFRLQGKQLP